jgi:hypothetical protein
MNMAILVGTFIICAVLCHYLAKNKGANAVYWGVMGAIFGPLAIPFCLFIKGKKG